LLVTKRSLLETARVARGLTQEAVARRSGTSQPTLSAYERGTKSPTLAVVERILHTLGYQLGLQPRVAFREVPDSRGRTCLVPDRLWRVDPPDCFAPITVRDRGGSRRTFDLQDRDGRAEAYAWLLQHGDQEQLFTHLDGALLVDAWPHIGPRLTQKLQRHWRPLVDAAREGWLGQHLSTHLRQTPLKPASARAQARAIQRLADRGLTAEQIRRVLRRRESRR
jgi:transcriptional regulator with XRE-family HTH domain